MSVIEAISQQSKTRVDGTLVITIAFEPKHAQKAFSLFGTPGTSLAVAALTQEAAKKSARNEMIETYKPKGGELARLAGMWCADPDFQKWIEEDCGEITLNEADAAKWVREFCEISSRAELDHNAEAAKRFHDFIRIPYSEWLKGR